VNDIVINGTFNYATHMNDLINRTNRLLTSPYVSLSGTTTTTTTASDTTCSETNKEIKDIILHVTSSLRANVEMMVALREYFLKKVMANKSSSMNEIWVARLLSEKYAVANHSASTNETNEAEEENVEDQDNDEEDKKRCNEILLNHITTPSLVKHFLNFVKHCHSNHIINIIHKLHFTSESQMIGAMLIKILRGVNTSSARLEECKTLLHEMSVKHLMLLAKSFVYPEEEKGEKQQQQQYQPLLSLYARKNIVTTIMSTLDDDDSSVDKRDDATLIPRALKQLKNWKCYLHAVEELNGSIASGEYSSEIELEQSMKQCFIKYSSQPKEAKVCFIQMAGSGLPCSLVSRVVMTHKDLKANDSRGTKLLIKLYTEAFDIIVNAFFNGSSSRNNSNWPPKTAVNARDAALRALSGLAVESEMDDRNITMSQILLDKLRHLLASSKDTRDNEDNEDNEEKDNIKLEQKKRNSSSRKSLDAIGKGAVLQVLTSFDRGPGRRSGSVSNALSSSATIARDGDSFKDGLNHNKTSTSTHTDSNNEEKKLVHIAVGDHITTMLEECSTLNELVNLIAILTGKDVSTLEDVATKFGLWVNLDATTALKNYEKNYNLTATTTATTTTTTTHEMPKQWKELLLLAVKLNAPSYCIASLLRGPCDGLLSVEEEYHLLDNLEVQLLNTKHSYRLLLIVALSCSNEKVRRERGSIYMNDWWKSHKEEEEEGDIDEEEEDELTSALICRWDYCKSIDDDEAMDKELISFVQSRVLKGLQSTNEKNITTPPLPTGHSDNSIGNVPLPPINCRVSSPRRLSMRRISSPALVRRRLDTLEETKTSPLPKLPPPTTCTMKFFIVILILYGVSVIVCLFLFFIL
jgi:hypothetical protein